MVHKPEHKKRHDRLESSLYKEYNERDYPKYDNYDAINVDKTKEIPVNYEGTMGVPITFLDKYNPMSLRYSVALKGVAMT